MTTQTLYQAIAQTSRIKLWGKVSAAFFFLAVLAVVDGLQALARHDFNSFELIPGETTFISGMLPEGVTTHEDLEIRVDGAKGIAVRPVASFKGFWLGGQMWRAEVSVPEFALPGKASLTVVDLIRPTRRISQEEASGIAPEKSRQSSSSHNAQQGDKSSLVEQDMRTLGLTPQGVAPATSSDIASDTPAGTLSGSLLGTSSGQSPEASPERSPEASPEASSEGLSTVSSEVFPNVLSSRDPKASPFGVLQNTEAEVVEELPLVQNPVLVYAVTIWPSALDRQRAEKSFVRRYSSYSSFWLAGLAALVAILAGVKGWFTFAAVEKILATEGFYIIHGVKKPGNPSPSGYETEGWQALCAYCGDALLDVGDGVALFDNAGQIRGEGVVREVREESFMASFPAEKTAPVYSWIITKKTRLSDD